MELPSVPRAVGGHVLGVLELGPAPEAVEVPHAQVLRQHVELLVRLELALVLIFFLLSFLTLNVNGKYTVQI